MWGGVVSCWAGHGACYHFKGLISSAGQLGPPEGTWPASMESVLDSTQDGVQCEPEFEWRVREGGTALRTQRGPLSEWGAETPRA